MKFSRGGQVDMTFCESFNNGVIKMYDEVQRAVRNRFQLDMDDYSIDNVLRAEATTPVGKSTNWSTAPLVPMPGPLSGP